MSAYAFQPPSSCTTCTIKYDKAAFTVLITYSIPRFIIVCPPLRYIRIYLGEGGGDGEGHTRRILDASE